MQAVHDPVNPSCKRKATFNGAIGRTLSGASMG